MLAHLATVPSAASWETFAERPEQSLAFETQGAFILVRARVDGVEGTYVLDSGAPGLIINGVVTEAVDSAVALDRVVYIGRDRVERLSWGPIEQRGVTAYVLDLRHLEASLGRPIHGLIGYEQLRQLPITIDYPGRELTFLRKRAEASEQGTVLKFRLLGHLPLVDAEVGGQRALLGFDTGSGVNLLHDDYLHRLQGSSAELPDMQVTGLGATAGRIARRSVGLTATSTLNWMNLPYGFADLARFRESGPGLGSEDTQIDGLLGKEWMQHRVITIDYARRRLYVR